MDSEDSDDAPLSTLVTDKTSVKGKFESFVEPRKKKKRKHSSKKFSMSFQLSEKIQNLLKPAVIQRPMDVWLYLKDFNQTGPYCCLLCSEWFINKSKIVVHYILNHKKDYCGICRYFVPDREAWETHLKFHTPWVCSQCVENFDTESSLRQHLSNIHKLVHCRICHFRVTDNDQYHTHLYKKHNVTNVSSKDERELWEIDFVGSPRFTCLLCTKPNLLTTSFFNHYIGFHHFTIKCLSNIISGTDQPFIIPGADVSPEFLDSQLKTYPKLGYVEQQTQNPENLDFDNSKLLVNEMIEIKQENLSENEDENLNFALPETKDAVDSSTVANINLEESISEYKGDEDFDVTSMEIVILNEAYFNYIYDILKEKNSETLHVNSFIDYADVLNEKFIELVCSLCPIKVSSVQKYLTHATKAHNVKSVSCFSCRVCATTFDTLNELDAHIKEELNEFDDLWLCQFCDKEFEDRQSTREHLNEHKEVLEYDNCFSPHLGFKCRYCPVLFWNEFDREKHHLETHFNNHKEDFYKCIDCNEYFSDKIWFSHHYLDKHDAEGDAVPTYLVKCCLCCVVMTEVMDMRSHFLSEHPEAKKIFCSLDSCQYRPFAQKKSFQFHLKSLHNSLRQRSEHILACSICSKQFKSGRARSVHITQAHGAGRFQCKMCSEIMRTLDERKLHYLICHPGHHPFKCKTCGKSFQYKSSLYMHNHEHSPNKSSFTCTYCGKVFAKRDSFREHVQIHEGPRHSCSYCPMRFVQRSNMLRHERRHTGERPYSCPHCPRTFADKGACNSHVRTHSKRTPFTCMYCGQSFVQKSKLTYHIRKHTGENLEKCSICSKLYTSRCALREHMKTHIIQTDSVGCPLCSRKYSNEKCMLRHLRTMHTLINYTCPMCRKALTSVSALRSHVITHSSVNVFQCKLCTKSYATRRTTIKHLKRRHSKDPNDQNLKSWYRRVDAWDCNLGLDEQTMIKIFGLPKRRAPNSGDFVTLQSKSEASCSVDPDLKGSGSDSNKNNDTEDENELEPTDFVTIKIEPVNEEPYDEEN